MDRVGFEPTTSATLLKACISLSKWTAVIEGELYCSNPIRSTLLKVVLCLVEGAIEEDQSIKERKKLVSRKA
jgi:hypothetical protein